MILRRDDHPSLPGRRYRRRRLGARYEPICSIAGIGPSPGIVRAGTVSAMQSGRTDRAREARDIIAERGRRRPARTALSARVSVHRPDLTAGIE
jgi:hypothetical protein